MINKKDISNILNEILQDTSIYIVDIDVHPSNNIHIELDKSSGISIGECSKVHKKLKVAIGEEIDNYNIQVSSPGLGKPFKVKQQYIKNIDKKIIVHTNNDTAFTGRLVNYTDEYIVLEKNAKDIDKNDPQLNNNTIITINHSDIKTAKIVIEF